MEGEFSFGRVASAFVGAGILYGMFLWWRMRRREDKKWEARQASYDAAYERRRRNLAELRPLAINYLQNAPFGDQEVIKAEMESRHFPESPRFHCELLHKVVVEDGIPHWTTGRYTRVGVHLVEFEKAADLLVDWCLDDPLRKDERMRVLEARTSYDNLTFVYDFEEHQNSSSVEDMSIRRSGNTVIFVVVYGSTYVSD